MRARVQNGGRASPMADALAGRVNFSLGLMGHSTKVDSRSQADDRRCMEMYRRIECSWSLVVFEMDRNFNVCYVSPGIRYFTGETPRLLIGKNFCNMIHKEDVKRVRPKFRDLINQATEKNKSNGTNGNGGIGGVPGIPPFRGTTNTSSGNGSTSPMGSATSSSGGSGTSSSNVGVVEGGGGNDSNSFACATGAGSIRYRRKKSGGGYMWVEAVGHSVGRMTGNGSRGSPKSAAHHTLVFSEREIGRYVIGFVFLVYFFFVVCTLILVPFFIRCLYSLFSYMELEAKLAHSKGLTLDAMVDNDDRQKQIEQSRGGWTSSVGDQTRAAAMASAGGQRR
jgi:hypothetical protein